MLRVVSLALLVVAASAVPVASAAGPCDNEVERLLCDLLEPVDVSWVFESVRHLCDHWLQGCEVSRTLP